MWGSKTVGISIAMAGGSWLINHYGFSNAVLLLSIATFFYHFVAAFIAGEAG